MLFDVGSAELPIATLRPRGRVTALVFEVRSWFAARWRWFRPRSIPVCVAMLGMCCVLQSVSYLSQIPAGAIAASASPSDQLAPDHGPSAAYLVLDGAASYRVNVSAFTDR